MSARAAMATREELRCVVTGFLSFGWEVAQTIEACLRLALGALFLCVSIPRGTALSKLSRASTRQLSPTSEPWLYFDRDCTE